MSTAQSQHQSEIGPVIVMGVSSSGKSLVGAALAATFDVPFIEGDELHPAANVEKMSEGIPLTDEDRWPWLDKVAEALREASAKHGGAIASCSALRRIYRDRLREEVGEPKLRFVFLRGSRKVLGERMQRRKHHYMPTSLLDSQFATLEDPGGEEGVLIVDVDGRPEDVIAAAMRAMGAKHAGGAGRDGGE